MTQPTHNAETTPMPKSFVARSMLPAPGSCKCSVPSVRRISRSIVAGYLLAALNLPWCANATDASADAGLSEIVVTAEKYNSTIQNTPFSISAFTGDQLAAAGITSVEQLTREVPGLSMRTAGPGQTEYEARGLASTGGAAPTVGFYVDEVPLSPPALSQTGKVVIDPNLYDINRIEILRGPQGTLYGAGSMGGTVKVITNLPVLDAWDASFQTVLSNTQGGHMNGGGSMMLNIPVAETLAIRVVGTDTYRSGWIDRVVLNPFPLDSPLTGPPPYLRGNVLAAPVQSIAKDVNTERLQSGRISALFQPSDDLSIVASAFIQHMAMGGYDEFDSPPGANSLAHYAAFDIKEPITDLVHIASLTATANLGFADLISASAYWNRSEHQTQDASESSSVSTGTVPYVSLPYSEDDLTRQISQELRLVSRGDDRLHWVAGGFFSNLHSSWIEYGSNPVYSAPENPSGIIFEANNPYWVRQYALFGDGSYKITDELKLSAGLRWFRYLSEQLENEWGYYAASLTPLQTPLKTEASDHGFNPRVNLSYAPTTSLTTYLSAAKGFRPGGANQEVPTFCGPSQTSFGPDTVWDYEVGEKARAWNNRININTDFYYIKWNGIQQAPLLACGYQYDTNAGTGRSFGPEVEVTAKLWDSWLLAASGTYTDAKITHPSANYAAFLLNGVPGGVSTCRSASNCTAPILNIPKETASISLTYETEIFGDYKLTARVGDTFVGNSVDEAFYYGIRLPGYSIADARVGVAHGRWSANLFVDNLADKVAVLSANNTSFQFNIPGLVRYSTNQPRTVGAQFNFHY